MLLNEIAPAAPLIIDALPSLLLLAALFFVVGCIYTLRGFVKALFGAVASIFSHIPGVGGLTSDAIHSAEHAISNALGTAEASFDRHIAAQLHRLATIGRHFWHQMEQLAHTTFLLAEMLSGYASLHFILRIESQIRKMIRAAEHQATVAIRHSLAHARAFTHSVAQGIYPRLRAVEHDVTRVIPKEIRTTRALAREAERTASRAWRLVRDKPWEVGETAFAGAVAIALTRLGLGWIRCNSANSFFKKAGCGFWKLLEDALGLLATIALAIFAVLRPQQLAEAAVAAVDTIEPILTEILKD